MEENKIKKDNSIYWKIAALIILGILLGIIIQAKWLSAEQSWVLNKSATCELPIINLTGIDCEVFWCNNVSGGNYSITKEVCLMPEIVNQTVYLNETNGTVSLEDINRTELEIILGVNLSYGNVYNQLLNASQNYTNIQNSELNKNLTARFGGNVSSNDVTLNNSNPNTGWIIVIIFLVVIILVMLAFRYIKQDKKVDEHFGNEREVKKIQPLNELSKDEKIRLLEKQVKANKSAKPGETPKVKDIEEEEFEESLSE